MKSILYPILLCLMCASAQLFSQDFKRQGNLITYQGNVFEVASPMDTINYIDSASGKEFMKIVQYDTMVVKMNGKKIYAHSQLSFEPRPLPGKEPLELLIFKNIKPELEQLPDDTYDLDMAIVTDPKGKLVFYYYNGLYNSAHANAKTYRERHISAALTEAIAKKLPAILSNIPLMQPGRKKGSNEAVCASAYLFRYKAIVADHKAVFIARL